MALGEIESHSECTYHRRFYIRWGSPDSVCFDVVNGMNRSTNCVIYYYGIISVKSFQDGDEKGVE